MTVSHTHKTYSDLLTYITKITYIRKPKDEAMYVSFFCSFLDLLLADDTTVIPILNVLGNGAVEQDGLLRHQTQLCAQPGQVQLFRVRPVR